MIVSLWAFVLAFCLLASPALGLLGSGSTGSTVLDDSSGLQGLAPDGSDALDRSAVLSDPDMLDALEDPEAFAPWDAFAPWLDAASDAHALPFELPLSQEGSVGFPACPSSAPACPWTDAHVWFDWAMQAGFDEFVAVSLELVPASGMIKRLTPSGFAAYHEAGQDEQRSAWMDWWLLVAGHHEAPQHPGLGGPFDAQTGMGRHPDASGDPFGAGASADGEDDGGSGEGEAQGDEDVPEVGKPRNLLSLWRAQAHGVPIEVHPWGGSGHLVMTNLGVFHFSSWDEPADWMVRFESPLGWFSPVGKSMLVEGDTAEEGFLVLEYADPWGWGEWETIQVIDLSDGTTMFKGFRGEQAAMEWTLSDATGDGQKELLVVDRQGVFSVIALASGQRLTQVDTSQQQGPVAAAMFTGEIHSVAFGDATDDGVDDLFVVRNVESGIYVNIQLLDMRIVTLYSGADGSVEWESVVEAQAESPLLEPGRAVVGDLTGDGLADLVLSELRVDTVTATFQFKRVVTGVSGATGAVLFHDKGNLECPVEMVCPQSYQPLAVVASSSGQGLLVGLTGELFDQPSGLVVRGLPEVAGLTSSVEHEAPVQLPYSFWWDYMGRVFVWGDPAGADQQVLVTPYSGPGTRLLGGVFAPEGYEHHAYHVDAGGITGYALEEELAAIFINKVSGEASGWFAGPDHWAPLSGEYTRDGTGQRLLLNVSPWFWHDANGDGVPDALVPKTSGFVYLSGKDGSVVRDVDMEPGWDRRMLRFEGDTPFILELRDGQYRFGALEADEPQWVLDEEVLDGAWVLTWDDYTGSGKQELFVEKSGMENIYMEGQSPQSGAPQDRDEQAWGVVDPQTGKWLWEIKRGDASGFGISTGVDALPERKGVEIMVTRIDENGERNLELHVVGESGPRWQWDLGESRLGGILGGMVLIRTYDEEERETTLDVHRASDRQRMNQLVYDDERPLLGWSMAMLQPERVHLVISYARESSGSGENQSEAEQRIRVVPASGGLPLVDFVTKHEGLSMGETPDGENRVMISDHGAITWYAGTMGDWTRSGVEDLVLHENGHFVVRSSTTGDILAVAPDRGNLCCRVDLNGDDRYEFGLHRWGSGHLRMYSYDQQAGDWLEDDDTGRVSLRSDDANVTGDLDRFFDGEDTPGPAVVLLLFVVGLGVAWFRRGERRA